MTQIQSRVRAVLLATTMLSVPFALSPIVTPAYALFGFGDIVFDPSNYAENIVQAARALEQINNQIASLQNEAQMLINQARRPPRRNKAVSSGAASSSPVPPTNPATPRCFLAATEADPRG